MLACAVTLPKSVGRLRLASRDPRTPPKIQYNLFQDEDDLDRMLEVVRLSRQIGRTAPFVDLVEGEVAPQGTISNDEALRAHVRATVNAYSHPTSTVPMGTESDPTAVVDLWGTVHGIEGLRVIDASILPDLPSAPIHLTTIMVAERTAERLIG